MQVHGSDTSEQLAFYETHIRPLLSRRCYQCHSDRADKREGGLRLDDRDAMMGGGDSGLAIMPGDIDQSLLVKAIRYADTDLQMPPTEKLPAEDIAKIETWIRLGAIVPANSRSTAGIAEPSDPQAGRNHWAFQPLVQMPVPQVTDVTWKNSTIDQWLQAYRERQGLRPVALAEPMDLLRRVSFQLVGLPPTESQIAKYSRSPTDETYALLVDELLASPQFGRRWGRHWLDLARYADSNGLDENFLFREAWRYRNWVLDAVNDDMPYDRFLTEQIAGDLLPYLSIDQRDRQRTAAGFLVVGPKVLLGVNPQRQLMDVADEQIETVGRAVLGQTIGCARCHDHKFDPIPTADYYALAGIFTSTRVMEKRHMLNEQRLMERLVGLDEKGEELDDAYEKFWREQPKLKSRRDKIKNVLEILKKDDAKATVDLLASDAEFFADGAKNSEANLADRIAAQSALLKEINEILSKPPAIPPRAMIPADVEEPADESVRRAGRFDDLADRVPRGFLRVASLESNAPIPSKSSGRLELSHWLTNPQSPSGWLAARVLANRVWHHLMGRGLVRTVDNFGRTGEQPSHPELLDFLAAELIESGWSLKQLVRKIVLTRSFQLSCQYDSEFAAVDPDNRFFWRANRRRLDPESLRDAMLFAAGQLDLSNMESTVSYLGDQATAVGKNLVRRRTDFPCRSVFLPVIRNDLPELFDVFDFANPQATTGARPVTTVPTQGLFMLNDPSVLAASKEMARRVVRESNSPDLQARVEHMFELALGSRGSMAERQAIIDYVQTEENRLRTSQTSDASEIALVLACHAVLASSQFQYLE